MRTPETQKLPRLIILCFFHVRSIFCVCRKIHLHSRNISLCRAWNRCVCCNIDCEHWHPMWFSFLPFIFEANWFHPFQMCLARRSYLYFHSGYGANGVIYITWNKLSWLRGLQRHIHSTCILLALVFCLAFSFNYVPQTLFFSALKMRLTSWCLRWGSMEIAAVIVAHSASWELRKCKNNPNNPKLKGFAVHVLVFGFHGAPCRVTGTGVVSNLHLSYLHVLILWIYRLVEKNPVN